MPDSPLSYASLLDTHHWLSQPRAVTLLTGPSSTGKTSACLQIIAAAHASGVKVGGLVTPGHYADDGTRIAIDLVDLATGARWPLAERVAPDPVTGRRWRFRPEALAQGDALLQASQGCDLLVIDEIGPLELREGAGWTSALQILKEGNYRQALVVIRPGLLDTLIGLLPDVRVYTIRLTEQRGLN